MRSILITFALLTAGTAVAEAPSGPQITQSYINILCSSIHNEPDATADYFRKQIRDVSMQNQSPSAIKKTEYDEDDADKVVGLWTALSQTERKQIKTQMECQRKLSKRYAGQ